MPTQDEEIARRLREALASGDLAGTDGYEIELWFE